MQPWGDVLYHPCELIGALLDGKYELIRLLGEGGMGAVYEAIHAGSDRRVAVKVISIHLLLKKDTDIHVASRVFQ